MLDPKEYDPEELRTLAGAASPTAEPADEERRWAKPADFLGVVLLWVEHTVVSLSRRPPFRGTALKALSRSYRR